MKRPFPIRRMTTITRANVRRQMALNEGSGNGRFNAPTSICWQLMGTRMVDDRVVSKATERHVKRCERLMESRKPQPEPTT